jgi:putative SOS response-associated peptidase YedK
MCGRFTLARPSALPAAFPSIRFEEFSETKLPRYNVAPSQGVVGVRNDGRLVAEVMRWGIKGRINVRAESVLARRRPVHRRCIEFADGFYEWHAGQPYYYALRSGEPFAFAGLWEADNGSACCDILTCPPNTLVAPVHDRMPVVLPREMLDLWLDPEALPAEALAPVLQPLDAALMESRAVSRRVNNANYDAADVLDAAEPRLF